MSIEFKNLKIFSIDLELEKIEKYLYDGLSMDKIPKNSPSFNKIRTILNIVGFQYLYDNYIVHLKESFNKNIDEIIKLYQFNETVSSSIIRQLWKIESLLTSRIYQIKNSKNIWQQN